MWPLSSLHGARPPASPVQALGPSPNSRPLHLREDVGRLLGGEALSFWFTGLHQSALEATLYQRISQTVTAPWAQERVRDGSTETQLQIPLDLGLMSPEH